MLKPKAMSKEEGAWDKWSQMLEEVIGHDRQERSATPGARLPKESLKKPRWGRSAETLCVVHAPLLIGGHKMVYSFYSLRDAGVRRCRLHYFIIELPARFIDSMNEFSIILPNIMNALVS